jgi:predicted DNA-binding transcriptional regulator AlpA
MSALLDTGQIAELLGLKRTYVTDKLTKQPDFPRPEVNRSQKLRRWKESDVMAWARGEQRSPARSPGSTSTAAA